MRLTASGARVGRPPTHGESRGAARTSEYESWAAMLARCHSPSHRWFSRYGGRGIVVCEEWRRSYPAFLAYMGRKPTPRHSIDRIDNDGNYEPGNVRWADDVEQQANRRNTIWVTIDGTTKTLSEWARGAGLSKSVIEQRYVRGWTGAALLQPAQPRRVR